MQPAEPNIKGRPQTLPEPNVVPRPMDVKPAGPERAARSEAPSDATLVPRGAGNTDAGKGENSLGGADTGREPAGSIMPDPGVADRTGATDKRAINRPDFDSALIAKPGLSPGSPISDGNSPKPGFDISAAEVFTSITERIQATDLERGRARFEIETAQGQTVRVRLTVDNNIVSARIDAPTEQVRDLLAGHAWELNQRLENEGLVPNDINFCLAGGREQATGHDGRPGIHNSITVTTPDEDLADLTMVETEAYAFESWA